MNGKTLKETGKAKPATGKTVAKRKSSKHQNTRGGDKKRKRIMVESDSEAEESNDEGIRHIFSFVDG